MLTIAFIFKLLGLILGCIGVLSGQLLLLAWILDRWAKRDRRPRNFNLEGLL
jgi:hypothetical protein